MCRGSSRLFWKFPPKKPSGRVGTRLFLPFPPKKRCAPGKFPAFLELSSEKAVRTCGHSAFSAIPAEKAVEPRRTAQGHAVWGIAGVKHTFKELVENNRNFKGLPAGKEEPYEKIGENTRILNGRNTPMQESLHANFRCAA